MCPCEPENIRVVRDDEHDKPLVGRCSECGTHYIRIQRSDWLRVDSVIQALIDVGEIDLLS